MTNRRGLLGRGDRYQRTGQWLGRVDPSATALSLGDRPFLWRPPLPLATAPSFSYRPFLWLPPSPCNNPLLFVIPREAEGSAVPRTLTGNVFPEPTRGPQSD